MFLVGRTSFSSVVVVAVAAVPGVVVVVTTATVETRSYPHGKIQFYTTILFKVYEYSDLRGDSSDLRNRALKNKKTETLGVQPRCAKRTRGVFGNDPILLSCA